MKNAALFVDVNNIHSAVSKRFDGKKVNYTNLSSFFNDQFNVQRKFAYGYEYSENSKRFISALTYCGFETKFRQPRVYTDPETKVQDLKRSSWDVGIAMDVVRMSAKNDVIILGSSSADLAPLADWITEKGLECVVIACGISKILRASATRCIEINESLLIGTEIETEVTAQ